MFSEEHLKKNIDLCEPVVKRLWQNILMGLRTFSGEVVEVVFTFWW